MWPLHLHQGNMVGFTQTPVNQSPPCCGLKVWTTLRLSLQELLGLRQLFFFCLCTMAMSHTLWSKITLKVVLEALHRCLLLAANAAFVTIKSCGINTVLGRCWEMYFIVCDGFLTVKHKCKQRLKALDLSQYSTLSKLHSAGGRDNIENFVVYTLNKQMNYFDYLVNLQDGLSWPKQAFRSVDPYTCKTVACTVLCRATTNKQTNLLA